MIDEMDGVEVAVDERPLYYLVVCPDTGSPSVEFYETLDGLATKLIELQDTEVTVMPFCGRRLYVSEGELRYLLDDGHADPIPLFTVPTPSDGDWKGTVRFGADTPDPGIALGTPADIVEEESEEEEEED
jgi:hypothetical protein